MLTQALALTNDRKTNLSDYAKVENRSFAHVCEKSRTLALDTALR